MAAMNLTQDQAVDALISLSNRYGTGTDYVIAGGGNTSWKNESVLWVKGSGQTLGTIRREGFVQMDRRRLAHLWTRDFSSDADEREKEVLAELMSARLPGEEAKRPSVETLLHDLVPYDFVVHTHPTLVNALTCAQEGRLHFERLFGHEAVWIPLVNPGYVLSKVVKDALEAFRVIHGQVPALVFLQNHGIVVAGNSPKEIDAAYEAVLRRLRTEVQSDPDWTTAAVEWPAEVAFIRALEQLAPKFLAGAELALIRDASVEVLRLSDSRQAFEPISSAYSPDHIVYMGAAPLWVSGPDDLPEALAQYQNTFSKAPRVILTPKLGAFCLGPSRKIATQAHLLFRDAVKIATWSPSFGGPLFMTTPHIDFIRHWEVESYRSRISSGN